MIKAQIYSKSLDKKGIYKPVYVDFPVSRYDLNLAYAKARISNRADCEIKFEKKTQPRIVAQLERLPKNNWMIDYLNDFAKQLTKMDLPTFNKLVDTINNNPADNYRDLVNIADNIYQAELPQEDDDMDFDDEEQPKKEYPFSLRMSNVKDGETLEIYVGLPYDDDIEVMTAYDLTAYGYKLIGVETAISTFDRLFDESVDEDTLNRLAHRIERMDSADFVKYMAVLDYEHIRSARYKFADKNELLVKCEYYADEYKSYTFDPRVIDAESYAKNILTRAGIGQTLIDHVNLESYGLAKLEESGAAIGRYGLIEPPELRHEQELVQDNEPHEGMSMSM